MNLFEGIFLNLRTHIMLTIFVDKWCATSGLVILVELPDMATMSFASLAFSRELNGLTLTATFLTGCRCSHTARRCICNPSLGLYIIKESILKQRGEECGVWDLQTLNFETILHLMMTLLWRGVTSGFKKRNARIKHKMWGYCLCQIILLSTCCYGGGQSQELP